MELYQAVAYAMRYWFVFVILAILLCVIIVSIAEYRDRKKVMANAQSYIGYLDVVYTSADNLMEGDRFALAESNVIGSSCGCNIVINDAGVQKKHLKIYSKKGGVVVDIYTPGSAQLNGRAVKHEEPVFSGDILLIGETALKVHLKGERV